MLAAITALYHDGDQSREIGVWGLRFDTERTASEAYGTIASTGPPTRGLLVRKGPMVVLVWRDKGVRDAAFDAISVYIENTDLGTRARETPETCPGPTLTFYGPPMSHQGANVCYLALRAVPEHGCERAVLAKNRIR